MRSISSADRPFVAEPNRRVRALQGVGHLGIELGYHAGGRPAGHGWMEEAGGGRA